MEELYMSVKQLFGWAADPWRLADLRDFRQVEDASNPGGVRNNPQGLASLPAVWLG